VVGGLVDLGLGGVDGALRLGDGRLEHLRLELGRQRLLGDPGPLLGEQVVGELALGVVRGLLGGGLVLLLGVGVADAGTQVDAGLGGGDGGLRLGGLLGVGLDWTAVPAVWAWAWA
jgi:hypothetical protein